MTRLQPFFSTFELAMGYLNLADIQKITKKELKNKCGIYGFICKSNNKIYIGSSIKLATRFNKHINGFQSNILLQRAINKYNLQDSAEGGVPPPPPPRGGGFFFFFILFFLREKD